MMRMKTKMTGLTTGPPPPPNNGSSAAAVGDWEVRPGGMLVQKQTRELKKMLTGPMGLHREDQKLMYKNKERDSKKFLDITSVKEERPNL
ncbi:hypothetical protein Vadar_004926 [Vaccinium darrowii]|uniref:Uncharacterized protein n=1 Tax=Vaccinium darrowii TaxID=229202 RepID=A0ACB7Z9L8_9ERIC|nr:hypothetical protein Vadar_004926 [Vaccinium darrowii]